jgi:hypothetical protein
MMGSEGGQVGVEGIIVKAKLVEGGRVVDAEGDGDDVGNDFDVVAGRTVQSGGSMGGATAAGKMAEGVVGEVDKEGGGVVLGLTDG